MFARGSLCRRLARASTQIDRSHGSSGSARCFTAVHRKQTDGVFRALTDERVQMPWVEALRKQQNERSEPGEAEQSPRTPKDRDLTPKKMDDNYHSVVCSYAQDVPCWPTG